MFEYGRKFELFAAETGMATRCNGFMNDDCGKELDRAEANIQACEALGGALFEVRRFATRASVTVTVALRLAALGDTHVRIAFG